MKETIKLLKYNNYFNRIIMKAGETANYYDDFVLYTQSLVNFNPNDGVNTEIVLNTNEQGDYVIVVAEDGTTINSRWFVLENERTRNGQAKLSLKRDVIADNFESILRSPCYVEKGTLSANDPLIYNSEGMLFNQIKTDEIMLKDRSATPWIVGYISRDYLKDSEAKEIHGKYNVLQSAAINASDLPWEFTSDPQIVGVTKGYRLTITSGDYIFHISTTYQGQTYSGTSYASEWLKLKFDDAGNYLNFEYNNNHPQTSGAGSIARYNASSNFNIYADSKGTYINAQDLGKWIENHSSLAIHSVPSQILDEQASTRATASTLMTYNGKIVKNGDRYYRIRAEVVEDPTVTYSSDEYEILNTNLTAFMQSWNDNHNNSKPHLARAAAPIIMEAEFDGVRIIPEPITTEELVVSIPNQSHRIHLNDAPYDMFAIPYGEITMKNANVKCNKDGSMAIAFYAAAEMGSGVVYDVQLLPYCPCLDWIDDRGRIDESYGQEGYEYSYIKDSQGNKKSIMIWCNHSSGTFNIEQKIEIERPYTETTSSGSILAPFSKSLLTIQSQVGTIPKRGILVVQNAFLKNYKLKTLTTMNISAQSIGVTDTVRANQIVSMQQDMNIGRLTILYNANSGFIYNRTADDATGTIQGLWSRTTKTYNNDEAIDIKISDNCDKYRLVSPNYNGQFEFSLAKNGGSIEYFNVDYTYKPYNPYIHVNPNFSGLYGRDFDDARGLICGGNFSLPIVTSAFTDFEVANKNYNAIFDREILNMDREHEIQRQEATFGAIAGAVKGGATGAAAGAMVGGPWGAVAGAAVGTLTSGIGGAMDMANLSKRQEEAKSFKTDMYNMNLQNVQAIPYSLAKTSAFTYNNKIWPIVEYYTCTDAEKEAFKNKLNYDGMTVNKITTLTDVTVLGDIKYVKGQMIRLSDITDDSHMAYTIYEEINKGVYL